MYRQFRRGAQTGDVAKSVTDNVVTRSLSNLSVTDLKNTNENSNKDTASPEISERRIDPQLTKTVDKCWEHIEAQCINYGREKHYTKQSNHDQAWKTVRIFVSSTFTDFFCERELLVKKVFPELREWCRTRKLYLVDCDMRWGVPKDFTTAETIATCLEELDRCIQETHGEPFFLNLLGQRYGWIPSDSDIPDTVSQQYSWVPNTSITFMEIMHGAYRMRNPNALFMLRDGGIMGKIPETYLPRYVDTDDLRVHHLQKLKTWLQSRFPDQTQDYSCTVEGTFSKYGREYVNITGLDKFSEDVLSFFKAAIEKSYPNREHIQQQDSLVLMENANQKQVLEETCDNLIGRQQEVELLWSFIKGNTESLTQGDRTKPFARDSEYWKDFLQFESAPLCLSAGQGYGKTTLMAHVTQKAIKSNLRVFYHFCGVTGLSSSESLLLQRLVVFLTGDYTTENLEVLYQTEIDKLRDMIKTELLALAASPSTEGETTVIIIDALDQLNTSNSVHHLSWLPPALPPGVRCLVSTIPHPPTLSRIREHPHFYKTLTTLSKHDALNITEMFLNKFNKKLDKEQRDLILSSNCSQNPLWLYFVCEELRIYGDFRSLTKQVKAVTTSPEKLLESIVQRLVTEDDTGQMEKVLNILACQRGVLTTLDMQRMLGNLDTRETIPLIVWAKLRRNLQPLLRIVNYNEQIIFVHNSIKMVINDVFMKSKEDVVKWNTVLADYIEHWCDDRQMKVEDLPQHLVQAGLKKRLVHFLREVPESSSVTTWGRSKYMKDCRCRNLADPVIKSVTPVYICQFCQMKKAKFHPKGFHMNKDMCVVCGNHILHGLTNFVTGGHLCQFHSVGQVQGIITKCFLCKNVVADKMAKVPGRLCQHCGFGNDGKRCVALNVT